MVGIPNRLMCLRQRKSDVEDRTTSALVLGPYPTALRLDDRTRDGQAHAHPALFGGKQGLKYSRHVLRGNAGPRISNKYVGPLGVRHGCPGDNLSRTTRRVVD